MIYGLLLHLNVLYTRCLNFMSSTKEKIKHGHCTGKALSCHLKCFSFYADKYHAGYMQILGFFMSPILLAIIKNKVDWRKIAYLQKQIVRPNKYRSVSGLCVEFIT